MRICQISKADGTGGGASRVAEELTSLLNDAGHETTHLTSWSSKPYGGARQPLYGRHVRRIHGAHRLQSRLGFQELMPFELPALLADNDVLSYDVVHFHDLSSAISPLTLLTLARLRPVVWTFHDCSAFTGGCLYPMGCERFRAGCGRCPQIGSWPLHFGPDRTRLVRWMKRRVHATGVIGVTPSRWMADLALSSGALSKPPRVVSNGVNTEVFSPRDKQAVRRKLAIPSDRPVLMFSSGLLSDVRKGTVHAARVARAIADLSPFLLLVGADDDESLAAFDGIDYRAVGYVRDPLQVADLYGAADVLLTCSLADNQPLTVLESLACGTPVVGFATGGIPEIFPNDLCGLLVEPADDEALARALRSAFSGEALGRWSRAARKRALDEYSHSSFVRRHIELYESVTS